MYKYFQLFGLAAILIFTTGCQTSADSGPEGASEAKNMLETGKYEEKPKSDEISVEQQSTEDEYMNIITLKEDDQTKQVEIYYPEFKNDAVDPVIEDYVMSKLDIFNELVNSQEDNKNKTPGFNINFDAERISEGVFVLVFNIDSEVSDEISFQSRETAVVNINCEAVLTEITLFDTEENKREHLSQTLLTAMQEDKSIAPYLKEDNIEKWAFDKGNDFSNVSFKGNELVFKFKQGEVTTKAAGEPKVSIPVKDLEAAMTEPVAELIN